MATKIGPHSNASLEPKCKISHRVPKSSRDPSFLGPLGLRGSPGGSLAGLQGGRSNVTIRWRPLIDHLRLRLPHFRPQKHALTLSQKYTGTQNPPRPPFGLRCCLSDIHSGYSPKGVAKFHRNRNFDEKLSNSPTSPFA